MLSVGAFLLGIVVGVLGCIGLLVYFWNISEEVQPIYPEDRG